MDISATVQEGMVLSSKLGNMQSKAFSIEVVTDKQAFANLKKSWRKLLKRSGNTNPFLSHDWLYTWWLWFGERLSHELSIVCLYQDESLLAIAPFYTKNKSSRSVANNKTLYLLGQPDGCETDLDNNSNAENIPCSEQLDIIIGNSNKHALVVSELADYIKKYSHSLLFQNIVKDSVLYELVNLLPQPQTFDLDKTKIALSIALPSSFAVFISSQNSAWRESYQQSKKLLTAGDNVEVRVYSKPDEIHSGLQSLSQLSCAQQRRLSAGKCSFDADHYMKFHEDICHLFSIQERVKIVSLVVDGQLLASVCYYQVNSKSIQVYQMASVKGDGISFSPMLVLMDYIIEQVIGEGCEQISFLSNSMGTEFGKSIIEANNTDLHTRQWRRKDSKSKSYFLKSAQKLYKALRVG